MDSTLTLVTDRAKMDLELIHRFLRTAYWSEGIPLDVVSKALDGSLCFGLFKEEAQIGFARVITDFATFAYIADVFIVPEEQGKGFGTHLLEHIMRHESLQGLRRWHLVTRDAQAFYEQFGFRNPEHPHRHMEIRVQEPYKIG